MNFFERWMEISNTLSPAISAISAIQHQLQDQPIENMDINQGEKIAGGMLRPAILSGGSEKIAGRSDIVATINTCYRYKIAEIAEIAITADIKKLDIAPMTECFHGQRCIYLDAPGCRRPKCSFINRPIFDLNACPDERWW
jgi:hypothetical protein